MVRIALVLLFAISTLLSQTSTNRRATVFYFGGSDCPFSVDEKNIANIDKMRTELAGKHAQMPFKFVMVVMDDSLDRGIAFAKKYLQWDELSIGKFYNNELMLEHVNRAPIPGVPHIMVYGDSLVVGKYNIPSIKKRTLLLDLVGESAIGKWIESGYPIAW
jgi:hypothetical protein